MLDESRLQRVSSRMEYHRVIRRPGTKSATR